MAFNASPRRLLLHSWVEGERQAVHTVAEAHCLVSAWYLQPLRGTMTIRIPPSHLEQATQPLQLLFQVRPVSIHRFSTVHTIEFPSGG
jgi:hypothetical protein